MAVEYSKLVYGGDCMLFIGSGSAKLPIAFSQSAKLSVSLKTRDVASKDSADWPAKLGGRFDWNASSDGFLSFDVSGSLNGIDSVYSLFTAKQPVNLVFASKTGTTPNWTVDSAKQNFTGLALITAIDMNAADNETATYTISLEGSSELVMA